MKKKATIYRMVTPDHLCPWGLKAMDILKRNDFEIEDHHLESQEANQRYKDENGYSETPQIFIEGERIGGYDDLREHLGMEPEETEGKTYQPVIAIFAVTFLMAITTTLAMTGGLEILRIAELFIAFSMCVLAITKLQDLSSFSTMFLNYDLLARKFVPYAYVYPFVEAGAGILMIAGLFTWVAAPAALFIATIGAISVFKAVYIDKRELECACTGGGSGVPLGFTSLTENLMMMAMAIWMMVKAL
ncbi:MauE/DoxX family redox-associated membrane protein [Roseibacillus persicicus]|uniref:Membrane protein n=1 Tax=Roseibacillus persicicus TaxID=454148 RepID=A0A918TB22_9BACT|nr:MauE/DoxX family redox-associated membrane protein [Roseibacillus persicicus]GHC40585.1 membrane protein [Roseibacillus persicicus]